MINKRHYTTRDRLRGPLAKAQDAPVETAAAGFDPLQSKSPEIYRASIEVKAMDTKFKGCTLCGNERVLHIASQLDSVDICPPCLTQVAFLIERAQRKGTL